MKEFKAANKKQQKLRLAITGLAGSGKTYTALRIATGMGKKIAVIDSEHSSSELYANRFKFDICSLSSFEIEEYVDAIESAGKSSYDVIIIDSLSHAWEKLLERVDKIADQRYKGNTFRAWSEGSELQKKLVESILLSPCHVIVTIRTKAEYAVDSDSGKTKITKLGTAPKQREGFEYELSLVMELSQKHIGFISKDRTGKFQDKYIELPGEDFGKQLIAWLNEGAAPPTQQSTLKQQCIDRMNELKNIMLAKADDGLRLFSDEEYNHTKEILGGLSELSLEDRLVEINSLLDAHKEILMTRLDEWHKAKQPEIETAVKSIEAELGVAKPKEKPATTQTATQPADTPKPESGKPSIKDEFDKMVKSKNQPPQETALLPAMFTEPEPEESGEGDGFEDDIPWAEEKVMVEKNLDIF